MVLERYLRLQAQESKVSADMILLGWSETKVGSRNNKGGQGHVSRERGAWRSANDVAK